MRILTIISVPGTKLQQMSLGEYVTYEQALFDLDNARQWLTAQIRSAKTVSSAKPLIGTDEYLDEYIQAHNVKFHDDGSQELL